MLARSYTIIEVTPTRLELAVVHGTTVVQSRSERVNPPEPHTDWSEVLRQRHATLTAWVAELGIAGSQTVLIFSSATTRCSVFSCPASAGAAGADRAARLALGEIAGYSTIDNPVSTQALFTDKAPIVKPGQTTAQKMIHTLAVVESEMNCQLLAQWAGSCGLVPTRLVPATAGPIATLMERCRGTASGETLQATLWFGEHESFFVVGDSNGLRMFRHLGMGSESLVESLLRPITPRAAAGAPPLADTGPVTLDRAAARGMLDRAGVPLPTDSVDDRQGLTGASVLPLMSPVLQRFSVEVKQSLRFGLNDKERSAVNLTLVGPGAGIRRLAETIGQLCAINVSNGSPTVENDRSSAARGNIKAFLGLAGFEVSLLPSSLEQAQLARRTRRNLWVGVGVAAAMVALYGGWTGLNVVSARHELEKLKASTDEAMRLDQQQRATQAVQVAAAKAITHVNDAVGASPDWAVLMRTLSQLSTASTVLTSVEFRSAEETGCTCKLTGSVRGGDDREFAETITKYIESFSALPAVSSVKMGATARTKIGEESAHSFDLTIGLVEVPYRFIAPGALAVGNEPAAGAQGGQR